MQTQKFTADELASNYYMTFPSINDNPFFSSNCGVDVGCIGYRLKIETNGMADFQVPGMGSAWLYNFDTSFHLPDAPFRNGDHAVEDKAWLSIGKFLRSLEFRPHENLGGYEEAAGVAEEFAKKVADALDQHAKTGLRVLYPDQYIMRSEPKDLDDDMAIAGTIMTITVEPVLRKSFGFRHVGKLSDREGQILLGIYALLRNKEIDLGDGETIEPMRFLNELTGIVHAVDDTPEQCLHSTLKVAHGYFTQRYSNIEVIDRDYIFAIDELGGDDGRLAKVEALFDHEPKQFIEAYDKLLLTCFGNGQKASATTWR